MRFVQGLFAAGLIAATTAACTDPYGYPTTAYSNAPYGSSTPYRSGYGYSSGSGYYAPNANAYYRPAPVYAAPAYATATPRYGANGDYDRDGVPNKYDRDANGDGVPDRYQR